MSTASTSGTSGLARIAAALTLLLYVVGSACALWFDAALRIQSGLVDAVLLLVGFGWFALLGALLITRQPRNPMGWLFAAVGVMVGVFPAMNSGAALAYERGADPSGWVVWMAWPNTWYWYVLLGIVFMLVPMLFPTGRLLSSRWRPVLWTGVGTLAVLVFSGALGPTVEGQQSDMVLANPLHVPGIRSLEESAIVTGLLFVTVAGVFASVVVRVRRSSGVERQQLKWFLAAVSLLPLVIILESVAEVVGLPDVLGDLGFGIVLNAIPLAIGLALLRYRLWDIDRIVSRTVAWGLVTAILLGMYLAGVLVASGVLRTVGGSSDLAVAASTLAVAAAFQPVRRRVQTLVDRRFNRERYDAAKTVDAFRSRLGTQVDLSDLERDVLAAVQASIAPSSAALWLKDGATS